MTIAKAISASLHLLSSRDRRKLAIVTGIQMASSLLDLAGVLALGLVAALAVAASTGSPLPDAITSLAERAGVSVSNPMSLALPLTIVAGTLLIGKSILSSLLTRRTLRFLTNRQAAVGSALADSLMTRSLTDVQERSSQETVYALTSGVVAATTIILGHGVVVLTEASLMVAFGIGLLILDPFITLFAAIFFALIALVLHKLMAGWAARVGAQAANLDVLSIESIQDILRVYRELAVSHRRAFYLTRFSELRFRAATNQSDLQFMGLVPKYVFEVALIVGAALLALSQLSFRDLPTAMGTIVVFLAAGSRIVPSMMRLQGAGMSVRSASGQAAPTFALADELHFSPPRKDSGVTQTNSNVGFSEALDFIPSVVVKSVSYAYPGSRKNALESVSLVVPAGTTLAIVGATGSGKSTLVDLLLGLIEPLDGSIEISSSKPEVASAVWPGMTSYVPQEVGLLNGTIRDNVALGIDSVEIDDHQVWQVLSQVRLANFLSEHRDGLETMIGEYGMRLSGGQRQRLGLARALYSNPKLLVLDEATSALDSETEVAVAGALDALHGDVTMIIVAHRLSTVRHADQVAFMNRGRLESIGSFEHVRRVSPEFDEQAKLLGL